MKLSDLNKVATLKRDIEDAQIALMALRYKSEKPVRSLMPIISLYSTEFDYRVEVAIPEDEYKSFLINFLEMLIKNNNERLKKLGVEL